MTEHLTGADQLVAVSFSFFGRVEPDEPELTELLADQPEISANAA